MFVMSLMRTSPKFPVPLPLRTPVLPIEPVRPLLVARCRLPPVVLKVWRPVDGDLEFAAFFPSGKIVIGIFWSKKSLLIKIVSFCLVTLAGNGLI